MERIHVLGSHQYQFWVCRTTAPAGILDHMIHNYHHLSFTLLY
jgi:hypothetical protein